MNWAAFSLFHLFFHHYNTHVYIIILFIFWFFWFMFISRMTLIDLIMNTRRFNRSINQSFNWIKYIISYSDKKKLFDAIKAITKKKSQCFSRFVLFWIPEQKPNDDDQTGNKRVFENCRSSNKTNKKREGEKQKKKFK